MNSLKVIIIMAIFVQCSSDDSTLHLHRPISYPESKVIKRLVWEGEPSRYPGSGSDMHWWTWGIDSSNYFVDDDGENFGGPGWYALVLKSTGLPPNHKVETVTDFQFYDLRANLPDKLVRRYVCEAVAVDSNLYVSIDDYDWNIPSRPVNKDTLKKLLKIYHPWNAMNKEIIGDVGFIDDLSKNYGVAAIIQSKDFGKTWTNMPKRDTPEFFSANFGAPAFLTFGPGNTQTPNQLAPYVYAISNDGSWATGDNVYIARVHRDSVVSRAAWQFYKQNSNAGESA